MTRLFGPRPVRSLRFRGAALLGAVLFLFSGVRGAFAHLECPHHQGDGHVAAAFAETGAHDAQASHAGHIGHTAQHHAPGSGSHDDFCTCIGPCQAAGASAVSASTASPLPSAVRSFSTPPSVGRAEPLPERPAFVLPFATAPPRSR